MFRAQPVVNKFLNKKWGEIDQQIHENKLRFARSSLDSRTPPSRFRHLTLNHKKEQQLEDRFTEIERENRILLEKMVNIIHHNKKRGQNKTIMRSTIRDQPHSNFLQRKNNLIKISEENQAILKRLQDK